MELTTFDHIWFWSKAILFIAGGAFFLYIVITSKSSGKSSSDSGDYDY
jgi:hypothetical protein